MAGIGVKSHLLLHCTMQPQGGVFCLTCAFHEAIFLTGRSIIENGIT
jgi:hypothetical protein